MAEKGITYKEETDPTSSADGVAQGSYGDRPDDYPVGPSMGLPNGTGPSMALPGKGTTTSCRAGAPHSRSAAKFADGMTAVVPGSVIGPTGVLPYGGKNQDGSN